jgi:hypothetical protein
MSQIDRGEEGVVTAVRLRRSFKARLSGTTKGVSESGIGGNMIIDGKR